VETLAPPHPKRGKMTSFRPYVVELDARRRTNETQKFALDKAYRKWTTGELATFEESVGDPTSGPLV